MSIPVGASHSETTIVDASNLASSLGSGLVDVFATPMMILLCENAASKCVAQYLDDGQATVGTHVDIEHSGATPPGMRVTADATVTAVDRRRIEFVVVVNDEVGEVGRGTHVRFIIDKKKFTEKAIAKGR